MMAKYNFHIIRSLSASKDLNLVAQFDDGTIKRYSVYKLSERNKAFCVFRNNYKLFSKAKIDAGGYGVVWNENLDLSANEIWANGELIENTFDGLISFSDASRIWNLNESTLRKALNYGKIKAGLDCCKYGKQWVITTEAMIREYGIPNYQINVDDDFSWNNRAVAEKEPPYLK